MTTMRFFVIGSWTEGMFHFKKLKPFIVSYEPATVSALVYRLPVGFPVLVSQNCGNGSMESADLVQGQLIELQHDETLLSLMDSLHGVHVADPAKALHQRLSVKVDKISGGSEMAQAYFFNSAKLTARAEKIVGGQWLSSLEQQPPMTESLTERQKLYVLKLGSAKGRDIVPINDLALYRELIKLDLIVDKGRRLALSSLGREVYSYLA